MALELRYCPLCRVTTSIDEAGKALMREHRQEAHKRTKRDIIQDIRKLLDELWRENGYG